MVRTFLTGGSLVLADRVVSGQTLVIEGDRIVEIAAGPRAVSAGERRVDVGGRFILPGFIDVHVHGAAGIDVLDGPGSVAAIARALPRWGVTAFCPTSVACAPDSLEGVLEEVAALRAAPEPAAARVLPAHLESNFINPEFRGAQPAECLRLPPADAAAGPAGRGLPRDGTAGDYSGADVLAVIDRRRPDVAIVTLAPEIPGGFALTRSLVAAGIRVSLGHSAASFDDAQAAIAAGATRATHLFNRMRPMSHRDPGLAGAVLADEDVAAELICDGHHVHPAVLRVAVAAKQPSRVLAITDGTAGSGLPAGARARLGGRPIVVGEVARLEDGTMAGSVATMDGVFRCLVNRCGFDVVQAAQMTATAPARDLGLVGHGVLAAGSAADFVVIDRQLDVAATWIGGVPAYDRLG
jgi:N-acetylglucosamine-6-phosphate deacetylase